MDQLTYNYDATKKNRLLSVNDAADPSAFADDVEGTETFAYDAIGNLTQHNKPSGNTALTWNAYGKVRQVTTSTATMTFGYDAQQNRLKKTVTTSSGTKTTYYIRDAQGNALAVYEQNGASLIWKEQDLYGSSRLGMAKPEREVTGFFWASAAYTLVAGAKSYELSNHLGNVMAVISDRGELQSAQDYCMSMPGRSTEAKHRYTFNGKETDPETGIQDYGMRWYLPNIARFPSVDPITKKYPELTPYQFASNRPIDGIDLDGLEHCFTIQGKYLGQLNAKTAIGQQVWVVKSATTDNAGALTIVDAQVAFTSHSDFRKVLGVVYNETSVHGPMEESAGITDVIQNRLDGNPVQNTYTKVLSETGIRGYGKADAQIIMNPATDYNQLAGTAYTNEDKKKDAISAEKLQRVTEGVLTAAITPNKGKYSKDYSGGATTWHGPDFSKAPELNDKGEVTQKAAKAYSDTYAKGFKFNSSTHNIWNMKDNPIKHSWIKTCDPAKPLRTGSYNYEYESTGAAGNTIFLKRTEESINAQMRPCNSNKQLKNGTGLW